MHAGMLVLASMLAFWLAAGEASALSPVPYPQWPLDQDNGHVAEMRDGLERHWALEYELMHHPLHMDGFTGGLVLEDGAGLDDVLVSWDPAHPVGRLADTGWEPRPTPAPWDAFQVTMLDALRAGPPRGTQHHHYIDGYAGARLGTVENEDCERSVVWIMNTATWASKGYAENVQMQHFIVDVTDAGNAAHVWSGHAHPPDMHRGDAPEECARHWPVTEHGMLLRTDSGWLDYEDWLHHAPYGQLRWLFWLFSGLF